jgi:NADPH2:quinone reductase
MKAIYLTRFGESAIAFKIGDADMPQIAENNEVIIKVACAGLNFADIVARRGLYPETPKRPAILGYEVTGIVHAIGKGVTDLSIGQRVMAITRFGGYAAYAKTLREAVMPLPENIDFASATALTTQACTAYYCAYECVRLHEGDVVLIQAAAGGVGRLLVQMAKHEKCFIYGTASTKKLDYLRDIGVDVPIDYTKDNFLDIIKKNGHAIDIAFDSVGGSSFKKTMKILNTGGRIVCFGLSEQIKGSQTSKIGAIMTLLRFGFFSPIQLMLKSQAIIAINMLKIVENRPPIIQNCLKNVLDMAEKGIITPYIDKVFKADDIALAHDYLESRQAIGKVVIEF